MILTLPIHYEIKTIQIETLMNTLKQEEVLKYCSHCNNYKNNYSCPTEAFDTNALLRPYNHASIILTKIESDLVQSHWNELSEKCYESRVLDRYGSDQVSQETALSMYLFNEVKDKMTALLLEIENQYEGVYSAPPGACTRCETCMKILGRPCVCEEDLRPSLEALGFMVSDIYDQIFKMTLEWQKDNFPKAFHTCSALFSQSPLETDALMAIFKDQYKEIEV